MTQHVYSRDEDGTLTRHRLYLYNGDLFTADGVMHVLCRDCGEPISHSN